MNRLARVLLLSGAVVVLMAGCSPGPTPSPSATVTLEAAARAYSGLMSGWIETYADTLNKESSTAGHDRAAFAQYAATLRDAYGSLSRGVALIGVPQSVKPAVDAELESMNTLVALATQLVDDPMNSALRSELANALGRVTQRSAAVDAALGLSH